MQKGKDMTTVRAWCVGCKREKAMVDRDSLCPSCHRWIKNYRLKVV